MYKRNCVLEVIIGNNTPEERLRRWLEVPLLFPGLVQASVVWFFGGGFVGFSIVTDTNGDDELRCKGCGCNTPRKDSPEYKYLPTDELLANALSGVWVKFFRKMTLEALKIVSKFIISTALFTFKDRAQLVPELRAVKEEVLFDLVKV